MHFANLLLIVVFATGVFAHPGAHGELVDRAEHEARILQARKCAAEIAQFEQMRRELRDPQLKKRQTATTTAPTPHYTTIQNSTCITAPEVVEGPYYIGNEYIRYDLRETQPGVKLVLDVGVIDTTTCRPFTNAFVELWAANSTGVYGGYGAGGNVKKDTFLRGGHFTNAQGIVELTTSYPGFYQGRTAHIHTMVHKNSQQQNNGYGTFFQIAVVADPFFLVHSTIISASGTLTHIGQFFFDESWNDKVYTTSPYTLNTQRRTLNSQDGILRSAGDAAFVNLQNLGGSLSDGLLGYITVAVDGSKAYTFQNKNVL
ncbi:unnamed protein product [Cyclocybe aegerita]|uniref:Intradiol ring-cleavage dioxygenases domain-containing protein n=1 Tax=Cyclocybe aegerita TaxID=1973307 RepID=A0A8S0VSN7_CYCAE|nr:unnamed protein product [Cyclocybe aegerita]